MIKYFSFSYEKALKKIKWIFNKQKLNKNRFQTMINHDIKKQIFRALEEHREKEKKKRVI